MNTSNEESGRLKRLAEAARMWAADGYIGENGANYIERLSEGLLSLIADLEAQAARVKALEAERDEAVATTTRQADLILELNALAQRSGTDAVRWQGRAEAAAARIKALEEGLTEIKALEATPIGDSGFVVGPASLLRRAQEIAAILLKRSRASALLHQGEEPRR